MASQQVGCTDAPFMLLLVFVRERGDDTRWRGEPSGNRSPPPHRIPDDSNLSCDQGLVEGLRQDQAKRWMGYFTFERTPPPPIISRLKGRVLRLYFHMLRIHYCFCLTPSARHWQMKLKYAADTQQQTPRLLSTTVSLPQRVCKFLQGNALRAKKTAIEYRMCSL